MNGKRVVLAVIKGSPSTSSNLFQAATMNRSYRTNDTNDNPSVWIPPRRTSGLFLCVCQTDVQTCSTSSGISMFHEGPLRIATSLYVTVRLANLCKPHSTSMVNLVVLTRTCLNMLNWEFLNLNIVYNSCNTYHVRGKACFSVVFNGFQWFSTWWHCSSSWSALVPPTSASGPFTSEDVSGATELTLSSSL